jgi:phosphoglucosamine mutase
VMINVPVRGDARTVLNGNAGIEVALRDAEAELAGQGRVILRPSGTEPVVRVTVEGREPSTVQVLAEQLADAVRQAVD